MRYYFYLRERGRGTIYGTIDVYDTVNVYGTIDVYDTINVYRTIDVCDTINVYGTIDVYEENNHSPCKTHQC